MIKKHFKSVNEEEVTKANSTRTTIRWLITKQDGSEKFSTRRFEIKPGGEVGLHTHPEDHHIYILQGKGQFIAGEDKVHDGVAGDTFYIPPNQPHRIVNNGKEVLSFICVIPYI